MLALRLSWYLYLQLTSWHSVAEQTVPHAEPQNTKSSTSSKSIIASKFQASNRNNDARLNLMLHGHAFASNAGFSQQRDWMA